MTTSAVPTVRDLNAMVAGQGGDGSLTVITLLGNLLGRRGFHLYTAREVASRIKGGHAAALLRGTTVRRNCMGDHLDLFMAFDAEAIELAGHRVAADGIVIFDSSAGEPPAGYLPDSVTIYQVPFARLAVRDLRRDLFKNSFGFGLVTRILSVDDDEASEMLEARFARRPELVAPNLRALRVGFDYADEHGLTPGNGPRHLARTDHTDRILISGNHAVGLGFLAAGGRFFAGYPITPATEILEFLQRNLPTYGGVVIQAEDELAAVNMALGAALTGTRAMVATSGPGISLMQEGVSHAGSAEIPLVIVDCQRSGPSTGMPTKPEQSDIGMLIHGGNGDFPRIVLAPGDPDDCFSLSVTATSLARRIQGPVYLMLDQAVAQDSTTVAPFDVAAVTIEPGKVLDAAEVAASAEYRRYAVTDDGISPWVVPGTPHGMNLVTGNERDEWGKVSTNPANRVAMADKRARKIDAVAGDLPPGHRFGNPQAPIGALGVGMQSGVMREVVERLHDGGVEVAGLQPRTLWPVPDETLRFIADKERVYVVEHNHEAQLTQLIASAGAPMGTLTSVLKYDGIPFSPGELAARILDGEGGRQ
jgi:2-oxoglutarate ferredoxin oxidoreductase subunit alpha